MYLSFTFILFLVSPVARMTHTLGEVGIHSGCTPCHTHIDTESSQYTYYTPIDWPPVCFRTVERNPRVHDKNMRNATWTLTQALDWTLELWDGDSTHCTAVLPCLGLVVCFKQLSPEEKLILMVEKTWLWLTQQESVVHFWCRSNKSETR